jgi:zinc transporter ZupT
MRYRWSTCFDLRTWASPLADILLPFTAADFLYIAVGILVPELQREQSRHRSLLQAMTLLLR